MARGKNAIRAERAREMISIVDSVESYQGKVVQLSGQLRELAAAMAADKVRHDSRVRELTAEVAHATSPEVAALKSEMASLRDELGKARGAVMVRKKWYQSRNQRLVDHFQVSHGMSWVEAVEELFKWDEGGFPLLVESKIQGKKLTPAQIKSVQKARGLRP